MNDIVYLCYNFFLKGYTLAGCLNSNISYLDNDLLICMAEQLKLPFVQINSIADVIREDKRDSGINEISEISKASLSMIEGYLLSVSLQRESNIDFEPVAVGSVIYDVSQVIDRYAKMYNCEVEVDIDRKCGLVMSSRKIFMNSMINLSYGLISAASNQAIRLVVASKGDSVKVGVYSKVPGLSKAVLDNARVIKGSSYSPLHKISSGMVGGVFVADNLMSIIGSSIHVSRYRNHSGLAVMIAKSSQLSLV